MKKKSTRKKSMHVPVTGPARPVTRPATSAPAKSTAKPFRECETLATERDTVRRSVIQGTAAKSDALVVNVRDRVYSATRAECRALGFTDRDAASFAEDVCDRLRLGASNDAHEGETNVSFYDLREEQDHVYPGNKRKVKLTSARVPVTRVPADVDSIVLHQTATEYGVSKRAIRLAGDVELARARRALDVSCHAMAFRKGYFVAAHKLRTYVNHANRLNSRSLGLEIEGRYPGLMDDPGTVPREDLLTTWGGAPSILTDATVDAACAALKWLVETGRAEGMPIKYIFAHRQSSNQRRSDPGEEIWRRVGLEYGVEILGLVPQQRNKWTQGASVPVEWDPDGVGKY